MGAAMGGRLRAAEAYVMAAMVLAAAGGRLLDSAGQLPGVHEAVLVRAGAGGWLAAVLSAALVAAVASRRWRTTHRLRATVTVAMAGQLAVFFGAEAVVRVASGRSALDPDGIVGALLQAGLAAVLLLALTVTAVVVESISPVAVRAPRPWSSPAAVRAADTAGLRLAALVASRGPPVLARC